MNSYQQWMNECVSRGWCLLVGGLLLVWIIWLLTELYVLKSFIEQLYCVPFWDDMPLWERYKMYKKTGSVLP